MNEDKDNPFCSCGLILNHKGKCMSVKTEHKEKIPKYSGKSRSQNAWNDYK